MEDQNDENNKVKRRLANAFIIPLTGVLVLLLLVLPFAFALIDLSHLAKFWAPILAVVTAVAILAYASRGKGMHRIRVSPGEMLLGVLGTIAVIVLSVAVLRIGGPSGGPEVQGPGGTLTIEANPDITFDATEWSVPEGEVTFVYEDTGDVTHTLTIEGMEDDFLLKVDHKGDTDEGTIGLPPGTYTLYCTIRGHREQGMEGTLTVESGGQPSGPERPPPEGTTSDHG
ncbi:MAG TPA: plastocyanin/azurin family copper-binding protein [Acidimicrobiia bacterium]|nr:plastocyanin/azurin family copper-binding protein [Acidimicrobiia bacterium]